MKNSKDNSVRCDVCQRNCLIEDQQVGFCLSRQNFGGQVRSLLYGQPNIVQVDPIEKKPFYHFKPGTCVATIGSWGCNYRCKQCLNSSSSWDKPAVKILSDLFSNPSIAQNPPKLIVPPIIKAGYKGIAFSYNEPVIWYEYALGIAKEFKKSGGEYCVYVTNGSWSHKTIDKLYEFIDAANIDFKGFSEETYEKQGAFFGNLPEMTLYAQSKGIFIEITTLLIPKINDNPKELQKMTEWIVDTLGPNTPWHLSQYDPELAPDKEFKKIPATSIAQLKKAAEIGKKAGLNHIYIWAPANHFSVSDTICPKCKKIVIKRLGWEVKEINIKSLKKENVCKFCKTKLNVVL